MTRDKIVSIEDIKAYCQMVMKDELKSIKVSRGTIISDKPKEGFVKLLMLVLLLRIMLLRKKLLGQSSNRFNE